MSDFTRYYDPQSDRAFIELQNKILTSLKEHPRVVEEGLYVAFLGNTPFGGIWEIEGNQFMIENNGRDCSWKRVN